MADLNFQTGDVSFNINGKCDVAFNPTDGAFVDRLFTAFESLDKMQEGFATAASKMANKREIFSLMGQRDTEAREIINGLFGSDVCGAIFGSMSLYALAGGLPVWANLMLAIIDEIDTAFAREQKATNPRLAKYTAKYSG